MSFKDIKLKRSYTSYGDNSIANSFLTPVLSKTKHYKRSVGFFSSSAFEPILDGVISLVRNNGDIKLITSPHLSERDIDTINLGYAKREEAINNAMTKDFEQVIEVLDDSKLMLLFELVSKNILDIKIVVTKRLGDYHDKLGLLEDIEGNIIAFYGSSNSSLNGYQNNYEKIRIARNWIEGENESVNDELKEFDNLWNGTNEFVEVYSFKESAKKSILNTIERKKSSGGQVIKLRDYQNLAIEKWVENDYHGFYVMATGTGKTWTAIFSAKKLLENKSAVIVICAPYKHLVKQWSEDVEKVFDNSKIILVSSENSKWEDQINEEIIRCKYYENKQIIVISTIASFNIERFDKTISKSSMEKLLIVDEAHRFTKRPNYLKERYDYMLGLSATPFSGKNTEKGKELMSFFGGLVFNLPIEKALEHGYLVPYNYYPIFVSSTEEEENQFKYYSSKMASCFRHGKCINPDSLVIHHRSRLRVISMVSEKTDNIDKIIDEINEKDHIVVYCGDGRLFDDNNKEQRHIQFVKQALDRKGYKPSQFTATENINKRMELVDSFNNNEISALAAIRCLDEGINIPSIKSALILSSNDDYREFVQRRGRILRLYKDKKIANIYDVIVLPSTDTIGLAQIELRRFYEYAKLAYNKDVALSKLNDLMREYELEYEDISIYDEFEEELNNE